MRCFFMENQDYIASIKCQCGKTFIAELSSTDDDLLQTFERHIIINHFKSPDTAADVPS